MIPLIAAIVVTAVFAVGAALLLDARHWVWALVYMACTGVSVTWLRIVLAEHLRIGP